MSIKTILQEAKTWVIEKLSALYSEIEPGLVYLEENVPVLALTLARSLLMGAEAGTPWPSLVSSLITSAEAQGIKLTEEAATVALNTSQNNLIATGTPHLLPADTTGAGSTTAAQEQANDAAAGQAAS